MVADLAKSLSKKSEVAISQLKALGKLAPKEMRLAAEWPKHKSWQVLISTILSAQTRDETTIAISKILYKKYPTLLSLSKAKLSSIQKIIRPINYYKTKAKHVLSTSKILIKDFNGKVPNTLDELLTLPGVGRKVGNVYLAEALKKNAIGVDTHVGRISQKLGWTKNKNPHKIEKDLEQLFPKKYWRSINYICVRFGRSHTRKQEDEIFEKISS